MSFSTPSDQLTNSESVKVLVRVRPLNNKEQLDINNAELAVAITSSNSLSVTSVDQKKSFQCSYDAVLGPYATQSQVYDKVKECTMAVMNGINATIFAYGQTGSGKVCNAMQPYHINVASRFKLEASILSPSSQITYNNCILIYFL
ncbi:hypothetical protein EON65_28345 [archaeon]|nr:MAG: hypothetical protein EON65_28345 [archaeon]